MNGPNASTHRAQSIASTSSDPNKAFTSSIVPRPAPRPVEAIVPNMKGSISIKGIAERKRQVRAVSGASTLAPRMSTPNLASTGIASSTARREATDPTHEIMAAVEQAMQAMDVSGSTTVSKVGLPVTRTPARRKVIVRIRSR